MNEKRFKEKLERRNKHNMAQLPDELQELVRMQIAAGKIDADEFFGKLDKMRVYRFSPEQRTTIVGMSLSGPKPNVSVPSIVKEYVALEEMEVRV